MGRLCPCSVQGHFGVIQHTCLKIITGLQLHKFKRLAVEKERLKLGTQEHYSTTHNYRVQYLCASSVSI